MKGQYQVEGNRYFMLPFTTDPDLPETVIQQLDLQGHKVHQANRMTRDGQLFHSLSNNGKKKSCIFNVEIKNGSDHEFGKVKYYLLARNTDFVVLCKYDKLGNICLFGLDEEPADVMVQSFLENELREMHFQAVKETRTVHCVAWHDIVSMCFCTLFRRGIKRLCVSSP